MFQIDVHGVEQVGSDLYDLMTDRMLGGPPTQVHSKFLKFHSAFCHSVILSFCHFRHLHPRNDFNMSFWHTVVAFNVNLKIQKKIKLCLWEILILCMYTALRLSYVLTYFDSQQWNTLIQRHDSLYAVTYNHNCWYC